MLTINAHHGTNTARKGKSGCLSVVHALFAQVPNVQLNGSMVLSGDELVGPRTAQHKRLRLAAASPVYEAGILV